ncbi:hypothetical protein B0T14DRAFT_175009 [Immersiella caudata]|uniref:Uncharacterized protein n=1 Tax=Immersiella caudata TaxID=314043 RepID=A0AA40C370_9PEZI|nr:hypothetical protein B0T14DRAFT_175009 [Immersiella caudata]
MRHISGQSNPLCSGRSHHSRLIPPQFAHGVSAARSKVPSHHAAQGCASHQSDRPPGPGQQEGDNRRTRRSQDGDLVQCGLARSQLPCRCAPRGCTDAVDGSG